MIWKKEVPRLDIQKGISQERRNTLNYESLC